MMGAAVATVIGQLVTAALAVWYLPVSYTHLVADYAYVLGTGTLTLSGTGAELLTNEQVKAAYPFMLNLLIRDFPPHSSDTPLVRRSESSLHTRDPIPQHL